MKHIIFAAALMASPAFAQDGTRSSDTRLDRAGIEALLAGNVITFFDGSKAKYAPDGTYGYTYTDDGPVWTGQYSFKEDSVCVDFDNGESRCDVFVMDGERAVLITRNGARFPVRNLTVYPG